MHGIIQRTREGHISTTYEIIRSTALQGRGTHRGAELLCVEGGDDAVRVHLSAHVIAISCFTFPNRGFIYDKISAIILLPSQNARLKMQSM